MESPSVPSFWGVVVTPGVKVELNSPDDYYTIITGAALPDYDKSKSGESSILKGTVHTTVIDKIDPEKEFDPETVTNTNFAYLTPEKTEYVKMNHIFSPLSKVELEVVGPHVVHVSGKYIPVDVNEDEEEEFPDFDDSDYDLDDEQLTEKLKKKYIQKPKDDGDEDE